MLQNILKEKLKYSVFLFISIISFFSLYHKIHHMTGLRTNLAFFMPIILIATYIYVDQFLLEQLQRSTKKLFLGVFSFSILFAWEYRERHSHYFPDIVLSCLIGFGLLMWLFTFERNTTTKAQTLSDVYDHKNNGFNLLRFILATFVCIEHTYYMGPAITTDLINSFFVSRIGAFAVYCFFAISGFFMVQSLDNSKNSKEFLIKRLLRIFPLFIILIIVGFAFYSINLKDFRGQIFLQAFSGVVAKGFFHFGTSWTLKLEFLSYFILLLLYVISSRNKILILIATSLFIALDLILYLHGTKSLHFNWVDNTLMNTLHYPVLNYSFFGLFPCFMVGSLMYLYKDKIICNKHVVLCGVLAYLFVILIIGNNSPTAFTILQIFIIPYLVIACSSLFKIQLWTKYGDYSYGIYLLNYPLLFFSNLRIFKTPTFQFLFIYSLTVILAILSWHVIEKQALKLKRYL